MMRQRLASCLLACLLGWLEREGEGAVAELHGKAESYH